MPKIIIDDREIECRDGVTVLQVALENGIDVPHYCYHPGLSIVASCRLCLMEMKMPDPKTRELVWSTKLIPSCQTMVRDGMEVRFDSEPVLDNRRHVMEYYLVNHPLDCPVCDQAGECYLQDYSEKHGTSTSRVVDAKHVNPKKDVGPHTLLYMDRCVTCTRCVRFTEEISGTGELCVVNRGSKAEIDIFPGVPLANRLQGNVVDICPVGSLLDKDFLFEQRVWFLRHGESICRGCSAGCAIRIDHNDGQIRRVKPRFNPGVNDWWICDDGRFGWKFVHDAKRLRAPIVRRGNEATTPVWEAIPEIVRTRLEQIVAKNGPASVAIQLSPEMACEEAWLLATFVREIAPEATLALGDVQTDGEDERFPAGADANSEKFVIRAQKNPNRRGIETLLHGMGGAVATREELQTQAGEDKFKAMWIVGGYPTGDWPTKELVTAAGKAELLIVQDLFPNKLTDAAKIVLPSCPWTEREGSFMNHAGKLQPFARALTPPDGGQTDGQYLYAIAGHTGLYTGKRVRAMMAEKIPAFGELHVPPLKPKHQH